MPPGGRQRRPRLRTVRSPPARCFSCRRASRAGSVQTRLIFPARATRLGPLSDPVAGPVGGRPRYAVSPVPRHTIRLTRSSASGAAPVGDRLPFLRGRTAWRSPVPSDGTREPRRHAAGETVSEAGTPFGVAVARLAAAAPDRLAITPEDRTVTLGEPIVARLCQLPSGYPRLREDRGIPRGIAAHGRCSPSSHRVAPLAAKPLDDTRPRHVCERQAPSPVAEVRLRQWRTRELMRAINRK
jgi:hypothetical protein